MADTLTVKKREQTGTLRMKRLRQTGQIPAVLYGHGEGTVALTVSEKELGKVIDHGSHIVQLEGDSDDSALIKEIQWNTFGSKVLHLDLTRVSATESVEVTISIELKGDAPGTHHGGSINFHQHEISIACPANMVPDKIELKISELDLDQMIQASDVILPEGATLAEDGNTPIVSCSVPTEREEVETEIVAAEPEVIGKKEEAE